MAHPVLLLCYLRNQIHTFILSGFLFLLKREASDAPLTADAKVVKMPLVERMVRALPSLLCYIIMSQSSVVSLPLLFRFM